MSASVSSDGAAFATRVVERSVGRCRLLMLPTPVRSVVSLRASFRAHPDFAAGEDLVQDLTASLLDKGTRHRDRFAVAEVLEDRGAQLRFYSNGLRVGFSGRALRQDIPEVLALAAEQLREPALDAEAFEKAKQQLGASLQRAMESTGPQATAALTRNLYPRAHPNHIPAPAEDLAFLADRTRAQVQAYHAQHFGGVDLTLVLVGDLDVDAMEAIVAAHLGDWPAHTAEPAFAAVAKPAPPGRDTLSMPDKQNIDVRFGHAISLRRDDEDFIPLYIANFILGGNFSSRLMDVIRDDMGLTYGIGSSLSGFSVEHDGHWQVNAAFSRDNLERGIEATRAELQRFVAEGVTAEELREKKETIAGIFKVNLGTTSGLAGGLMINAERGFDVGYLDRYPTLIEAAELETVNAAVRRHLDPDALHLSMAGTL